MRAHQLKNQRAGYEQKHPAQHIPSVEQIRRYQVNPGHCDRPQWSRCTLHVLARIKHEPDAISDVAAVNEGDKHIVLGVIPENTDHDAYDQDNYNGQGMISQFHIR